MRSGEEVKPQWQLAIDLSWCLEDGERGWTSHGWRVAQAKIILQNTFDREDELPEDTDLPPLFASERMPYRPGARRFPFLGRPIIT